VSGLNIEQELDRLYARPLAEFIGARNELAKTLRISGDRQAAAAVKTLTKPSVTAWAVNVLYHQERQRFDELLEAAAAVRAALVGQGNRRKADAERRKELQVLLRRAAKILAAAGHAATPTNRHRISLTLETLASRGPSAEGPRPGRLTRDLEPQGFDVLAGLAASLATGDPVSNPSPRSTSRSGKRSSSGSSTAKARDHRLQAARQKVAEQQAALAQLERDAERADATMSDTVERHQRLAEERAAAEQRVLAATAAETAAMRDMAAAEAAATKARAARRRALSRLQTARRQFERLGG
jgi:hypothetical protein